MKDLIRSASHAWVRPTIGWLFIIASVAVAVYLTMEAASRSIGPWGESP